MTTKACVVLMVAALAVWGCQKSAPAASTSVTASPQTSGSGAVVTPDVGAVTPAPSTTLDSAAGGGVNSAAMKKAKAIAAQGVGSVNNAQRQGYGATDDTGG